MPKHMVSCVACGRQFDANSKGTLYDSGSRRYTCPQCAAKRKKIQKAARAEQRKRAADERERTTGMRQTKGAMIAKFVVGALFVVSSFSFIASGDFASFAIGICIGAAIIAWGGLPYIKAKKQDK